MTHEDDEEEEEPEEDVDDGEHFLLITSEKDVRLQQLSSFPSSSITFKTFPNVGYEKRGKTPQKDAKINPEKKERNPAQNRSPTVQPSPRNRSPASEAHDPFPRVEHTRCSKKCLTGHSSDTIGQHPGHARQSPDRDQNSSDHPVHTKCST
ncbi:hypothetical protein LXL04_019233 [Taraxacum kok-saghyz]